MENLVNEEKAIVDVEETILGTSLTTKQKAVIIGGLTLVAGIAAGLYWYSNRDKNQWVQMNKPAADEPKQ